MKSEEEVNRAVDKYADTVYRICMLHLKNASDTEDIFQEVFLKYAMSKEEFSNEEHEKAWLIRVTMNQCRDLLKSFFRNKMVSLDRFTDFSDSTEESHPEVLEAVLQLPDRYKEPLYLCYFEGYSAAETAVILHRNVNTVYSLLKRGREKLRGMLGGLYEE